MKTLFLTLLVTVSLGTVSFSQEIKSVVTQSKSELVAAKSSGVLFLQKMLLRMHLSM
jgi:hypothetical protein